jgi:uncharacterized protein (TIGR02145 family)
MASELSMNGKKKIETLQKEFTQKFAYLTLVFLDKERRAIDISKSLSEVRQAKGDDISIIASLKVNTLEKRFLENFGIIVEVAYQKSDKVVYTKDNVDKTLNELNKWCEENDCQPFDFKKSFTGNTLSSVQEQLFEAIKAYYPNSEAKKINKDNYLDVYVPELNKKRGTHLFFNTAKDGIKIGFYCRDEEFIENILSKSSNIEKYAQGIRILDNPLQNNVNEATEGALSFIKEIIGEQENNTEDNLISKLIGDFTETFDLNDYLGYNLTERPGKMSVYEVSSNQMELALESKELDFEFEFKGCVDLNDWDALSDIIGKKESIENKKEYSKETINQSGNINFLYCEGTYVYSVLNPGDSDDVDSIVDDGEDDLDQILKDLGYKGDEEETEDEDIEEDELDEQNIELIKALEVYNDETTAMVQMFSQFGITEVGNGSGSWEGNNYTYDYRTEWNEGYLEDFEAISVESLIELLKTKNINEFTQDDFGSLGVGTLRDGNTTYENFKWASDVNKKDIKNAPEEEELCGDGDKQDCEYEWTSPERIEFIVTEDDKEELTFTLINKSAESNEIESEEADDEAETSDKASLFFPVNATKTIVYDEVYEMSDGMIRVKKDDLFGFLDKEGNEIVPCSYLFASDFKDDVCYLVSNNEDDETVFDYINKKNEKYFSIKNYSNANAPNKYGAWVQKEDDSKWEFYDLKGNSLHAVDYDYVTNFKEGYCWCIKDKTIFLLSISGKSKKIITSEDEICTDLFNGLFAISVDEKYGFYKLDGTSVSKFIYDSYKLNLSNGFISVCIDEKWGVMNSESKVIIPCIYDDIEDGNDNLFIVTIDDKKGIIDVTGNKILEIKYDDINGFENNYAIVQLNGLYGVINKSGTEVLPCISLDWPSLHSNQNFVVIYTDNGSSLIDLKSGKPVFKSNYSSIIVDGNNFLVKNNDEWGWIDNNEKVLINFKHEDAWPFNKSDLAKVQENEKFGFIDKAGNVKIKPIYTELEPFEGNYSIASLDGEAYGIIDKNGNEIVEFKYSSIEYDTEGFFKLTPIDLDTTDFDGEQNETDFLYEGTDDQILTVSIGNQRWATLNLNVDKFRNGDPIPHAESEEEWVEASQNFEPAWCYYNNDPENGKKYGRLYNWYAVNDSRGLAPDGWRIPSEDDFNSLFSFIEEDDEVNDFKLRCDVGWGPDSGGTNETGFTALPGGYRNESDGFIGVYDMDCPEDSYAAWWSGSEIEGDPVMAAYRAIDYEFDGYPLFWESDKGNGYSVRCIKK